MIDTGRALLARPLLSAAAGRKMFTFTLRHYTRETPIITFDPDFLSQPLILAGIHHLIVAGYVKRWRHMLSRGACA
ncbi:hypothetical protein LVY75_33885 (plasmid) [Sinorhizobium sp. B11]